MVIGWNMLGGFAGFILMGTERIPAKWETRVVSWRKCWLSWGKGRVADTRVLRAWNAALLFGGFADPVVGEGGVLQGRLDLRHVAGGAGLCADGTGDAWVI